MHIIINDSYLSKQKGGWCPEGGRSFTLKKRTSLLLLSCVCVCVSHSVVSSAMWPVDCSPPGSSVHGILQASKLEWVAIPFSRGPSQPRDQTWGHLHCRQTPYHLNHQIIDPLCAYCQPKGGMNSYSPVVKVREVLLKFASISFHPLTDTFASPCKNFLNHLCLSQNNHYEHQVHDFKSFSMQSISADTLLSVWNKIMFYNLQYPFPGLRGSPL